MEKKISLYHKIFDREHVQQYMSGTFSPMPHVHTGKEATAKTHDRSYTMASSYASALANRLGYSSSGGKGKFYSGFYLPMSATFLVLIVLLVLYPCRQRIFACCCPRYVGYYKVRFPPASSTKLHNKPESPVGFEDYTFEPDYELPQVVGSYQSSKNSTGSDKSI